LFALLGIGNISANSLSQDSVGFEKGAVVPRVTSQTDSRHTYALYLPTGYTPARKWPVLFAFDPGARGQVPVERFQEAAEKYGYIVMGSNNSRNGPVQVEFEAMRALYSDARRRFSIDENRLYSTGFSGAARVATQMGLRLKGIVEAIIVGGGFPLGAKPSAEVAFTLYGIAGEADLNFNEMLRLHRDFTGLGIPNHFEVLPGGHQWPSSEVLREAIEWMELQAMRKGKRPRDPELVAALLTKRLASAAALEEKGELAAAFRRYGEISKDFSGLADLKDVESNVARLKAQPQLSKALKEADKRDERMEQKDDLQTGKLTDVLNFIFSTGGVNFTDGRAEIGQEAAPRPASASLGSESTPNQGGLLPEATNDAMALEKLVAGLGIGSLKNTIEKKPGTDDAILAERQKSRIFISTFESARMLIEVKKYAQAVMCLEITNQAAPDNAFAAFNLARAQALSRKKSEALKSLSTAAEKGFGRPELIEKDEVSEFLRGEPQFAAALEKIRAQAAAH
jgi:predicted esterase